MKTHAFRLLPGSDLKTSLQEFTNRAGIKAGIVLTCVGSLARVSIRFAGRKGVYACEGKHEILSLSGTLSRDGAHLHIALADENGKTLGGHLADGCIINTTAELVLGELPEFEFAREADAGTGYKELVVKGRGG